VIAPQVALEMIQMMNSVVENGTGKRAMLDGVKTAGKTGTTNGWRDAWFVGYTGNFTGAVWMGNDDYSPTKRMTGGTIPALIWHDIMAYAHQSIELRQLPGLPAPQHAPAVATAANGAEAPQQILLTRKGTEALVRVERLLDDARHALAPQAGPGASAAPPAPGAPNAPAGSQRPPGALGELGAERGRGTLAAATDQQNSVNPRRD
jgi:penicillin-binding protein 1A